MLQVLFSDIQGFTKIAEEMNPEVLIDELDKFFFHFDSVVEKYDIEKIKTIGDAYMCAGGIPEKNRTNPVEVVLAALEMQEYMLQMKGTTDMEGVKFWDIRIGYTYRNSYRRRCRAQENDIRYLGRHCKYCQQDGNIGGKQVK